MKTALLRTSLFTALLCLFHFGQSQTFEEITKSIPELRSSSAGISLGYSIAINSSFALVGAPYDDENGLDAGAAYLFQYDGTLEEWVLLRKYMPDDGEPGDQFGWDVAISGSDYYISAPGNDDMGTNAGAVYFFESSATTPRVKFYGSDVALSDDFGYSIAVVGNYILVGAPDDDDDGSNGGAAYVFERAGSGSSQTVTELDKLTAASYSGSSAEAGASFGWDVAISSVSSTYYLVIGAPDDDNGSSNADTGRAYVFSGSGSSWSPRGALFGSLNSGDRFGYSVDIYSDDRIIVGEPYSDPSNISASGYAYVFHNSGFTGTQTFQANQYKDALLRGSSDRSSNDNFGFSVGVTNYGGYKYFVGSKSDDDAGSATGAVYVFDETNGTVGNVTTTEAAKFISDGTSSQLGSSIGFSTSSGILVSGAPQSDIYAQNTGAFYGYRYISSNWSELPTGLPTPYESTIGAEFGQSVDVDGIYAVVGAPNDDQREGPGSAYVLEHTSSGWQNIATLTASDGADLDAFGYSVSISGDLVAIGAPENDAGATDAGAVYIFEKPMSGWEDMTETQKLSASNGGTNDAFGRSVDLNGTVLAVGAEEGPSSSNSSSGTAYVFENSTSWTEVAILNPSDGASSDDFGASIAHYGDVVVVGSPSDDDGGSSSGSLYVFEKPMSGWSGTLTETAKLTASNASSSDFVGTSVDIEGDVVVTGARGIETAYVFVKPETGWVTATETAQLTGSNNMGQSVAISGNLIVSGAYTCCSSTGFFNGGVFLFEKSGTNWTTQSGTPLQASNGMDGDYFGYSVALSGQSMIVGAPIADTYSGAAYTYELPAEPTDIEITSSSIDENSSIGSPVGMLSSLDPNLVNGHSYAISGTDAANFSIGGTGSDQLLSAVALDHEDKESYEITITSTDSDGLTYDEDFTISINDVPENPTDISLSGSSPGPGGLEKVETLQNRGVGSTLGTFNITDQDTDETHTLVISGTDAGKFQIGGNNDNELRNAEVFLAAATYNITVTATDNDELTYMEDFIIEVLPNQTPTDIGLSGNTVVENNDATTLVGSLTTADADVADEHSYSISGTDAASFTIAGTDDDELHTTETFDFEVQSSYSITITTDDGLGGTYDEDFIIEVTNLNDNPPTDISLDNSSVDENVESGFSIATISTTDVDGEDSFTYSISGTDAASFTVGGDNNDELLSTEVFDFEVKNSYQITITTTDAGGLTHNENFTISIENVNDDPSDIQLSNSTIQENQDVGTIIGSLTTTDQDEADAHTYTVIGDNASLFQIGGTNNDELQSTGSFDLESVASYLITIQSNDGNGGTYDEEFTITITNENEVATAIAFVEGDNEIEENASIGSVVGILETTDVDAGDSHTYAITGTDAASFDIDGANVISTEVFDFETTNSYSITITTSDAGGLQFSDDFTITISDGPDAPTDISLSNSDVEENGGIDIIGELTTTDQDEGDEHSYSISGTDAESFQINFEGDLLLSTDGFDFETKNAYSITLTTEDEAGLTYSKDFTINVLDNNDTPSDIELSFTTIDENLSSGALVGSLATMDQDESDTHTYGISGPDKTSFVIGGINNDEVLTAASFDFESKGSYEITIITDDGEDSFEENYVITINDTNDQPTGIEIDDNRIAENDPTGTVISIMSTIDEDATDNYTYTIDGEDAGLFQIDGDELQVGTPFNFEEKDSYTLTITSTDQGGLTISDNFSFSVGDRNDPPTLVVLSANTIEENAVTGTFIGSCTTEDEDPEQINTHTYSVSGIDGSFFTIGGDSSDELVSLTPFDFETKSEYSITITTEDPSGATHDEDFVINVTDANDEPTSISIDNTSIVANRPIGTVVALISTEDQDAGDQHTYSIITGTDSDNFQISGNELQTAAVIDGTQSSYNITLVTTDSGEETFGDSFTLTVIPNNAPTALSLSNTVISSGLDAGSVVGQLSTTDSDTDDVFTYIISGTDAASFQIGGDNNNELQVAEKLLFSAQATYNITITSNDLSGDDVSDEFIIEISAVLGAEGVESFVEIYPNPSQGKFNLNVSEQWVGAEVTLVDIKGSELTLNTTLLENGTTQINLEEANAGIFFINLQKGDNRLTRKIVIE